MGKQILEVLIIDSNQILVEGYKSILANSSKSSYSFSIQVIEEINDSWFKKASNMNRWDVVLIEFNLTSKITIANSLIENFLLKIKKISHRTKVLIVTKTTDRYKIYNYIKKINPEGFLLKSEVDPDILFQAIHNIINGNKYYSSSIIQILQLQLQLHLDIDDIDRSILHNLSKGVKTKDLVKIVPLSLAGIEKRKRRLRDLLKVEAKNQKLLIEKASDLGII
ncbi:hypothetical protein [uncultured Aquimarina sp.]|uniref:hypothetical protein n=1 Tax=uncultured Aquimarina sp. TaxID=575652 RepID=UPI0026347F31|nr:hypothetical protein [uncultured Aquimarina sp.]